MPNMNVDGLFHYPIKTERKRKFALIFVIYSFISFLCRLISFASLALSLSVNRPLH